MYRSLIILFSFIFLSTSFGYAKSVSKEQVIELVYKNFEAGKYDLVLKTLSQLDKKIAANTRQGRKLKGLIQYWNGMCYSRLSDYNNAEESFNNAIKLKFLSENLYYEYGQTLYVQDKYKKARIAFKKSVQKGYKKAVSLYYIGFISQELKDYKKAVTFYNMIERLDDDEKDEIIQAARMQVADIYLKRVEKMPDTFKSVEKYVIPQYEKALNWNKNSNLASEIKQKIETLQRKYELILFKMRNGRNTARPPYYYKVSALYGINDNVNAESSSELSSKSEEDYASHYMTTSFFARYSYYPNSSFSYAPELSGSYTKYNSDSDSIIVNNNYYWKGALKTNFEHMYNTKPATFYMDFDYTYTADDADADKSIAFASTATGVTLSEELQIWKDNPSTFRYGYTIKNADDTSLSTTATSLTFEQIILLKKVTLFSYNNYTLTRYSELDSEVNNTDAMTFRLDAIFPTLWGLFNPTLYGSYVSTNYLEDSDKGITNAITYGINMNRPLWGKFYLTVDLSNVSQSADVETEEYENQIMTFNIDYIY